MTTIKAFKEFSDKGIQKQGEISRTSDDEAKRKKAKRFRLEMMVYSLRSERGDFDSY
jgi:hypothetical protein